MNILYSVMLLLLQRRCDPCSFLRLKYAQFPAIILLVIFFIYLVFTVYIIIIITCYPFRDIGRQQNVAI